MRRSIAHVTTVDLTLRFLLLGQLVALREAGFDVTAISAPGPWVADLEEQGIRHIAWTHATRSWNPREDALAFRELFTIFRRERFDLVHTHNPKPGVMGRVAARLAGIPRVANTVHGFYATPEDRLRKKAPIMAAEWMAARFSDLEVYQSAEDLSWARRLRIGRPGRSIHLGSGVDLTRFHPEEPSGAGRQALRRELGIAEEELVVGTVGRMVAEKGYLELFEAARVVRRSHPQVRFLAIGDRDTDKVDAISEAQIEGARDDVLFTGWREDIPELMGAMDVFVLPSWREGLPRSAIEAAATGLPSVLTDIRGSREVARPELEALFVPAREAAALARAIERLVTDDALRRAMGVAARARALERFDELRVRGAVVQLSRSLLASGRSAGPAGETRIRKGRITDVATLARLHTGSMPTAFLPTLGTRFLARLYRSLVEDAEAIVLVAEDDRGIVGFVTGVLAVGAFYRRFIRRHWMGAGLDALPRLLRPATAARLIETVRYPDATTDLPDAELLSIAVEAERRGGGVGASLVEALTLAFRERGVTEFRVVVGTENVGANRFYEHHRFRAAGETVVHEGVTSNVWVRSCPS